MKSKILKNIDEHFALAGDISAKADLIKDAAVKIIDALKNGGTLYVCGNGGSAADSQHFVAELMGRFAIERRPIKALSLTTNTSILTCIGNDYSFDEIFERQVDAFLSPKDILFGISTSGNSLNVLKALKMAKSKGSFTISLLGKDGGKIAKESDLSIIAGSGTPRIQEMHILIIHILCSLIENEIAVKIEQ